MSRLVISLVRGSVRTAYGAARHPISTASSAVGLATEAVRLGVGVVQGRVPGSATGPEPTRTPDQEASAPEPAVPTSTPAQDPARPAERRPPTSRDVDPAAAGAVAAPDAPTGAPVEPVTDAPGEPQSSGPVRIPSPEEIAVRAAGPMPGEPGEAFATEPKVASRDVEHGGSATADREAVDGFLEEMDAGEPESPIEAIGSTTGTPEPGEEASLLAESETLQRAAERNPED